MKRRSGSIGIAVIFMLLIISSVLMVTALSSASRRKAGEFLQDAFLFVSLETIADLYAKDVKQQLEATVITAPLNPFENTEEYVKNTIEGLNRIDINANNTEVKAFIISTVSDEKVRAELLLTAEDAELKIWSTPLLINRIDEESNTAELLPIVLHVEVERGRIKLHKTYKFISQAIYEQICELKIIFKGEGGMFEEI